MKYAYFPAVRSGTGKAYEESLVPVMKHSASSCRSWTIGTAAAPPRTWL